MERDLRRRKNYGEVFYFNSHAHVERDPLKSTLVLIILHFNSHAHVERDKYPVYTSLPIAISTHTLTWSVTRVSTNLSYSYLYFNSHAHVERDL